MGDWYSNGDKIPQTRSYGARRARQPGKLGRRLAWAVLIGSLVLLTVSLAAPSLLRSTIRLVPSRYLVAYAPEWLQTFAFDIDPDRVVPTPVAGVDQASAEELLTSLAPTPSPIPPTVVAEVEVQQQPEQPAFVQPTSAPAAATPTATPAYMPGAFNDPNDFGPLSHELRGFIRQQQTFNNCGPTTLAVTLSYYLTSDQVEFHSIWVEAIDYLKPYEEDRNVSPWQLVDFARTKGLEGTVRVNGNVLLLKRLIAAGFPVIVEKGYDPPPHDLGWMGLYLVLMAYSDEERTIRGLDTYRASDDETTYEELDKFWRHFNRTYIVLYRPEQAAAVASIIGPDMDDFTMYSNAALTAQAEINLSSNDPNAWFNLGSSLVGVGRYDDAALAYDKARELGLPFRMTWYQFGYYEAYYRVGRYDDMIAIANQTIDTTGRTEETYYYRGLAFEAKGQHQDARKQFQEALNVNERYYPAEQALNELESSVPGQANG